MCALDVRPAVATERLILRGPVAADVAPIAELANDLGVAGMTTHLPYPYRQADAEAFVGSVARMNPRTETVFAVEHRQFGFIGMLGIHEREPRRPELGYWFGRPFWGRGYATEAVTAALRWAKGDWRRNVVWAGHFADNPASGQVLCKAGFLYTGDVEPRVSAGRGGSPAPTRMMVWLA
ncbi:MAG: N-acetyltransferase [Phenylobacterium sp.]|uniref:GNAT family N-acetyltransferase n=1 Tax=Phenylobacterium sp. TaxID=1871053 RepID=UPI0012050345|nr:GNAT family N-acetyltransferase [Phenylobacterium sp.]TAJ69331.1 MAG: N-acetyltransferase [Phenylobacterium sp.]